MPALRVEEVRNLQEFTQLVESLMGGVTQLWYRGVGKASHIMKPSLYRHPTISAAEELLGLEERMLQRFSERSIPYEERPFLRDEVWEYLFLMQHFGVPTRLLDWTENPFIGLYFAVTGATIDQHTLEADEPACVWILNPRLWNATSLSDISFPEEIVSVPDKALESFEPSSGTTYMRNLPVAMYGLHNSARIVAQRGVFAIFGQSTDPMDEMYAAGSFPPDTLVQARVPANAVHGLLKSLFAIGITDSVVYPDLMGLSLDLKRFFGFQI